MKIGERIRRGFGWLDQGRRAYSVTVAWLVLSTLLVYLEPRALIVFLMLAVTPLLLYATHTDRRFKIIIAALFLLISVPVAGARNLSYIDIAFQVCAFGALAVGLNIVVGFAGLLDLGYIAFYAVGAYLWAVFGSQQLWKLDYAPGVAPPFQGFPLDPNLFWLFLFLGVGLAALAGILLGTPVLRLRGDYLAIVTLGFGEVIRVLALNLDKPINLTNGPQGITPIQRPPLPPDFITNLIKGLLKAVAGPTITDAQLTGLIYNLIFYLLALILIGIFVVIVTRMDNSRLGRSWIAIREDETAAIAMGIPLVRTKLLAFAMGASFSGAMGVLVASFRTFVSPDSFQLQQSINILVMVILGGIGSIPGVILGAGLVTILNLKILPDLALTLNQLRQQGGIWAQLSTQLDPAKYQRFVFGIILVVMMIKRPAGLLPAKRRQMELEEHEQENIESDSGAAPVAPIVQGAAK
ncbi:MAG TPA: branched-chain amino acid ABC transporter permease [Anaerolineae bacterium]|nr:branched-chain amino acid ABC transporter permease [Anaerolineae bacterium]